MQAYQGHAPPLLRMLLQGKCQGSINPTLGFRPAVSRGLSERAHLQLQPLAERLLSHSNAEPSGHSRCLPRETPRGLQVCRFTSASRRHHLITLLARLAHHDRTTAWTHMAPVCVQVSAQLFGPPVFNARKLRVTFLPGASASGPAPPQPRRYTLTHNDITGQLALSIGAAYNWPQVSGWYTRLIRCAATPAGLRPVRPHRHASCCQCFGCMSYGKRYMLNDMLHS